MASRLRLLSSPSYFRKGLAKKETQLDQLLVQEQVLIQELVNLQVEAVLARKDLDDEDGWHAVSNQDTLTKARLDKDRVHIREVVMNNPYCFRALRLYKMYCFGADFKVSLQPLPTYDEDLEDEELKAEQQHEFDVIQLADRIFRDTIEENSKCWSPDEFGERSFRDGEQFTRQIKQGYPLKLRFIDPEEIADSPDADEETFGITTEANDVCTVTSYHRLDPTSGEDIDDYTADEIVHTKIDCDSNELRGRSRFHALTTTVQKLEHFIDTETRLRNLQASIAIVRKIAGSGTSASAFLNNQPDSTVTKGNYTTKRERIVPGSIATISGNMDLEFKQPRTDFSDASPLLAILIKQIATVTGWTYPMISMDTGEGNLANSIVQESPVHQMVLEERNFFKPDLVRIFKTAIECSFQDTHMTGRWSELGYDDPDTVWDSWQVSFKYGDVIARDPHKEASSANLGIMNGSLSRAEGSRRMGADPRQMAKERMEEADREDLSSNFSNQNPDMNDVAASSKANASTGGNQGDETQSAQHSDNAGVGASQNT